MTSHGTTNPYCEALGIPPPVLEAVSRHREASLYRLLIAALLEHGAPMTLIEVAERFASAGIASADQALASLQRCRPARPPVYRDGDRYALDLHDDDLDLLLFVLDLRSPGLTARLAEARRPREPVDAPLNDGPLTQEELTEAWRDASLYSWSAQRVALCILDAHRRAMTPAEAVAFVAGVAPMHPLRDTDRRWGRPSPIRVLDDGRWDLEPDHPWLPAARRAVRARLTLVRKWAAQRPDPAEIEARRRAAEEIRGQHAAELARLRRVVVHAFPPSAPQAVVLVDVSTRDIAVHARDELPKVCAALEGYDVIAALQVRPLLRALGFEPGSRRLAELSPPQKSMKVGARGHVLKITLSLLLRSSCGLGGILGNDKGLRTCLLRGHRAKLHARLETEAKALFALYQYGRLHGAVRLRWRSMEARIPAPWVHHDETTLHQLKRRALELQAPLEIVAGRAPDWGDPWADSFRCTVVPRGRWDLYLVSERRFVVPDLDVQLARLLVTQH